MSDTGTRSGQRQMIQEAARLLGIIPDYYPLPPADYTNITAVPLVMLGSCSHRVHSNE